MVRQQELVVSERERDVRVDQRQQEGMVELAALRG
jgi:hypothetical protein